MLTNFHNSLFARLGRKFTIKSPSKITLNVATLKSYRLPILVTERWARSWSRCTGNQPVGDLSHPPGGKLPLLSARPAVTFPAAEHHRPLAGTKLYRLVTEAHRCEQLAQGCYAAFALSRIWTHDLLIASPTLYPLCHRATHVATLPCEISGSFITVANDQPVRTQRQFSGLVKLKALQTVT